MNTRITDRQNRAQSQIVQAFPRGVSGRTEADSNRIMSAGPTRIAKVRLAGAVFLPFVNRLVPEQGHKDTAGEG